MATDIEHDSRERLSNEAEHWWQCPDVVPRLHYVISGRNTVDQIGRAACSEYNIYVIANQGLLCLCR